MVMSSRLDDSPSSSTPPVQKPPVPEPLKQFWLWLKEQEIRSKWSLNADSKKRNVFIPINRVREHLRDREKNGERLENILGALYEREDHLIPDFERTISNCVAMLCILIRVGRGPEIHHFLRRRLYDACLPFDSNAMPKSFSEDGKFYKDFCEEQWTFCAPDFPINMDDEFDANYVLPIVEGEGPSILGGSAKVRKIRIHSSHDQLLATSVGDSQPLCAV
jgi:hypothetical protein